MIFSKNFSQNRALLPHPTVINQTRRFIDLMLLQRLLLCHLHRLNKVWETRYKLMQVPCNPPLLPIEYLLIKVSAIVKVEHLCEPGLTEHLGLREGVFWI